ncbi:MAG: hypothetical protein A2437_00175 [Bacteroidetes bacterium RIFOXYC2_FULL_40_12]|nr:MAG: hypothetical protein A2437_00175 [Bacteroidetes bacterium RIFOXYC2_FULL_40_12]
MTNHDAGRNARKPTETGMFYDCVLGTGGFYSQSEYLTSLYYFSFQRWSGTGEKALWQNLDLALARGALAMCLQIAWTI